MEENKIFEREYYIENNVVQAFGSTPSFSMMEVVYFVNNALLQKGVDFPFLVRLDLMESNRYYTINGPSEWEQFMNLSLGDSLAETQKSDVGDQEIFTFRIQQSKRVTLENLQERGYVEFGAGSETVYIQGYEDQHIFIPENPSLNSCFADCIFNEMQKVGKRYLEQSKILWSQFVEDKKVKKGKIPKNLIFCWNSNYASKMIPSPYVYCIPKDRQIRKRDVFPNTQIFLTVKNNHYCRIKNMSDMDRSFEVLDRSWCERKMMLSESLNN